MTSLDQPGETVCPHRQRMFQPGSTSPETEQEPTGINGKVEIRQERHFGKSTTRTCIIYNNATPSVIDYRIQMKQGFQCRDDVFPVGGERDLLDAKTLDYANYVVVQGCDAHWMTARWASLLLATVVMKGRDRRFRRT